MKPDWDKLITSFSASTTILVADVDCTAGGKSKCQEVGVKGYPTIKYGDPDHLQDYEGGRDFDSLKKFADGLGPMCGPANIDLCDEDKKAKIAEYKAMDEESRWLKIEEQEQAIAKLEEDFKEFVQELQSKFDEANKKKEAELERIKDSGIALLKGVQKQASKREKTEL